MSFTEALDQLNQGLIISLDNIFYRHNGKYVESFSYTYTKVPIIKTNCYVFFRDMNRDDWKVLSTREENELMRLFNKDKGVKVG